jgi:uncharacterized RDD family membrane protein YckC
MTQEALQDSSQKNRRIKKGKRETETVAEEAMEAKASTSTLLEFPGSSRAVPEWRKQLSLRVREVQERKAREAAEELAAAQASGAVSCALPSGQLELVADVDQAVRNPIVSKALERLERARRIDVTTPRLTAVAAAPARVAIIEAPPIEIHEEPIEAVEEVPRPSEAKSRFSVVTAPADVAQPLLAQIPKATEEAGTSRHSTHEKKPVRVISDDDVALSYLETCLSVPALEADTRRDLPGFPRRVTAGVFDLVFVALMVSPAVAAIYYSGANWTEPRVIYLVSAISAITMFAYLTITVALTGRTLAMRMFSLRTIDLRTGLIPTGGQSIRRAVVQVLSLAVLGLGLLYALIDPDKRTVHDRLSNTIVVRA